MTVLRVMIGVSPPGVRSMRAKYWSACFFLIAVCGLSAQTATEAAATGSEACASCHSDIYKTYSETAMAQASGLARDALVAGEFSDKASGVHYRVFMRDGQPWMSYARISEAGMEGERELLYFIGSGKKGRSYLFQQNGFLFETPINWYSQEGRWNMTPAYIGAREIPLNLPSLSSCLDCHTSDMQAHIPGTGNRFSGAPFLHNGITCERCHGSGQGHLQGKGPIVNPAKLSAERRDSICMGCHFEGTVSVNQPGKQLSRFQPGDRLSDYIHYFILPPRNEDSAEALSQFEALARSACKRKSGDKMWCGSCHDAHASPVPSQKVAYYRAKCVNCHDEAFAAKHHPDKPDCVQCHMPALPSKDVAHTQSTDHRILRSPSAAHLSTPSGALHLEAFPETEVSHITTRDLALAWENLAQRGVDGAGREAEEHLREAVKQSPDDASLLTALGFAEQQRGKIKEARDLYERALKVRPQSNTAATNLGILEARGGNVARAIELWQGAFERVPYRSAIGMNLATAFCAEGKQDDALRVLQRVLEFNPDFGKAKQMLAELRSRASACKP